VLGNGKSGVGEGVRREPGTSFFFLSLAVGASSCASEGGTLLVWRAEGEGLSQKVKGERIGRELGQPQGYYKLRGLRIK
jgi:hypothetical protein